MGLSSVEVCAGAGGQALGLERAGFSHEALVEVEPSACETLRFNRPEWNVVEQDLLGWSGAAFKGVDLLAGGVPCPPFSKAGRQLGAGDERNLFPKALELVDEIRPSAVMFENVRGLLDAVFAEYRASVDDALVKMGYVPGWRLVNACDFGVSQLRPRVVLVALRPGAARHFEFPVGTVKPVSVGVLLRDLMSARGWMGVDDWVRGAGGIAPTLVGGSKKHGGADLGPTRARRAWAALGVEGKSLADAAPDPEFVGLPRLTVKMAARVQGFPDDWCVQGRKTAAYRQVGNAFPAPVARSVAVSIRNALVEGRKKVL